MSPVHHHKPTTIKTHRDNQTREQDHLLDLTLDRDTQAEVRWSCCEVETSWCVVWTLISRPPEYGLFRFSIPLKISLPLSSLSSWVECAFQSGPAFGPSLCSVLARKERMYNGMSLHLPSVPQRNRPKASVEVVVHVALETNMNKRPLKKRSRKPSVHPWYALHTHVVNDPLLPRSQGLPETQNWGGRPPHRLRSLPSDLRFSIFILAPATCVDPC